MKALVFGCTGQDGSLLCRSLLRQGIHVIGVSRSSNPNLSTHQQLGIANAVELTTADLCDFREILELVALHNPDEIYNLAAQSSVGLSFQQPVDTFNSIINGTINLLEVVRFSGSGCRMYFAGSSEIFGNTTQPADVTSPRQPLSPYAIAKDASFNTVNVYRQAYGMKCVTGILFNHESPYRSSTFVTRKIVEGALRCRLDPDHKLRLGNLSVSRDWGWAEEYVEAIQLILRAERLEDQVICTGRAVTLEYFVDRVFGELGMDWHSHVTLVEELLRPSEIEFSVGNPQPMQATHGWRARKDVDGVITALLASVSVAG
ncbi:GDP-D-mannose dehydratase [Cyanobium sp. Copco_Reservoir_LC18]|uniref:GDP-mannose 4,6-dehydratase n=1 Tax=Cyanobium sp. Copco_Reservoir_LC18 TaxID=1328305 RepID=UPI0013592440|nr:GDP-mannose 4,6-dehydratase [Cyanobium sp. Copco_Reservoir_LC18]KAF0653467.1 GDP-D-mannose dehydratase [Cyanobium sp. Copco_Reservoir_LC18]